MMKDDDLIKRGDALKALDWGDIYGRNAQAAIEAVPAVQPTVKPLVWESHPMGWIAGAMFGPAYIIDVRIKGRVMFIKGMNPPPQFDDLEAAKAAAQADYEARILSALDMQLTVSPELLATTNDVAALVEAARTMIDAYAQWSNFAHGSDGEYIAAASMLVRANRLRAALARVKGETK